MGGWLVVKQTGPQTATSFGGMAGTVVICERGTCGGKGLSNCGTLQSDISKPLI